MWQSRGAWDSWCVTLPVISHRAAAAADRLLCALQGGGPAAVRCGRDPLRGWQRVAIRASDERTCALHLANLSLHLARCCFRKLGR